MQKITKGYFIPLMLCIFCFFFPEQSFSQSATGNVVINTRYLSLKDGLASKLVNCGLQDSKGFIWFGTNHGLQRYDGKNFKLFTKEKDGLQDNNVLQIVEDQNHLLWIRYGVFGAKGFGIGKVDVLDLNSYTLQSVSQKFGASLPFKEEGINTMTANEKNELLINTNLSKGRDVLWLYTREDGFRELTTGIKANPRNRFYFKGDTLMYYYSDTMLSAIAREEKLFNFQSHPRQNITYMPLGISADGRFYIYSGSRFIQPGMPLYPMTILRVAGDGTTNEIANPFSAGKERIIDEIISGSFYDPKTSGIILAHDKKGVYLFNGKDFVLLIDSNRLKENRYPRVFDYFTTANNCHWLCTSEGIIEIIVKSNHFRHFLSSDVIKFTSAVDHQVRGIYADSAGIYTTGWTGFYRITKNDSGGYDYNQIVSDGTIGNGDGFYYDGNYFWMGKPRSGINRLSVTDIKAKYYPASTEHPWAGITTREGKILIGTADKLVVLEGDSFRIVNLCDGSNNYRYWFYKLFYSNDGKLWAVTNKGLLLIENGCIAARYYAEATDEKFKIPFTDLHCVYEDKNSNFWLATNGGGIIKWNRKENSFKQFTVADGLSSNVVYSILEDENGFFWMSSEYGIMRFDPVSYSVRTYTTDDGLTENEFNRVSYFKAKDGQMFFGGLNGINAFYPKDFRGDSSRFNVPLRVVSFNQFAGNKNQLTDKTSELLKQNSIILNPEDKFFTIEFQLLDFEEGRHRYAYMIEGIDKDWNYISENSIRLSGLPEGDFKLRIKGQNFEGAWSKNELTIPLLVLTPVYKTNWFIIASILFSMVVIYLMLQWRTRSLTAANALLETRVGERTLQLQHSLNEKDILLKEIHHRVKNNLQVISTLLELQSYSLEDEKSKAALHESQNRVQSIALIHQRLYQHENLGFINFNEFAQELYSQVSSVFKKEEQQIEVSFNITDISFDIDTAIPLGLILNELLTNTFKYAFDEKSNNRINISINNNNEFYELNYHDNGKGFPLGFDFAKAKSLGTRLVTLLAKQLSGKANYIYDNGARIIITFKAKK